MPKILTDAYRNATFIVPFTEDKSEYVAVRPLSDTEMNTIRLEASKEAGCDDDLANRFFLRKLLEKSLTDWQGFYDVAGNELAFSKEIIKEVCECDSEFAAGLALRIRNVARIGEIAERKNS